LCLDKDEVDKKDEITGVYGWKQEYSLWTPAAEKKQGQVQWKQDVGRQIMGYSAVALGAGSIGNIIGAATGEAGKTKEGIGGVLNFLGGITGQSSVDGSEWWVAGIRGALQGGLQTAAGNYGRGCFLRIMAGAGIQAGTAIGGFWLGQIEETAKTSGEVTGTTTEEAAKKSGLMQGIGSAVDLGGWFLNRLFLPTPGTSRCEEIVDCFHDDVNRDTSGLNEIENTIAADYKITACRQPGKLKWEITPK